jgi:hypothetical protein
VARWGEKTAVGPTTMAGRAAAAAQWADLWDEAEFYWAADEASAAGAALGLSLAYQPVRTIQALTRMIFSSGFSTLKQP